MRNAKHYSVLEVLNFSQVGLLFEFYTTKETKFVIDALGKKTGKNIVLTNEKSYIPSYANALLIKEYDAARSRYKFHLAPQDYHSILPILDEVTGWISENCETTYDTQLKISLSFNHRHLDTLESVSQMNPTRLFLKFDEGFVYKRFPEQKGSPYALSIKNLAPIVTYINEAEIDQNIKYILTTPHAEFYGIDFTNYTTGVLECNYIGGKDYASKPKEIKDILEYFIIKAYQSINEEEYTDFENFEMKRLTEGFDKMQMAYYDPDVFLKEFANLKIYVDLKTSVQTVKTYWNIIRKPLFEMIVNGGLREGVFNYDAQLGRFQLKNAKLAGTSTNKMDLVKCQVSGLFENCDFVGCDITKARIVNSKFIRNNKIYDSYLNGASINKGNELHKCVVFNNEEMVNCDVFESLIMYASPGKGLVPDAKSTIIITPTPLPQKSGAVQVEEIRDYSWIKAMNKQEDQGFRNEYDRKTFLK